MEVSDMSYTIYVQMKKLGKQKKETLKPVPFLLRAQPHNLKDLICLLVELGVDDYNARRDEGQILGYLTKNAIAAKAESGKISFDLRGGNDANKEDAITNALTCFEDGIYRVFAGEKELTELDAVIPWTDDLVFTFIRLTMLSGW